MANVKLSQIASGGTVNTSTDTAVAVRSGTTDVLISLGTLASQSGTFSGTSSGTNTGDQTITLTGGVTGSGAGSFAATVVTNANLTGPVTSTGNATSIASNIALPGSPTTTTQSAGDSSTKISTTAFVTTAVNNAIAGVNPAVAVFCATTQASDTSGLTYSNGVSGIGATLTGSVNTALTFDGQTLTSLTQRVLVKNDTQSPSGAFNGIYTLTQLQTGILAPILTRALDYDAPSDINNTGAIPVVNGTVNSSTSWLLTSTVNTVGTDPLTYVKFSINPTTLVVNNAANTFTAGIQYLNGATLEEGVFSNGNSGTTKAVNLDNGNLQSITITGAVAITQTTPTHPGKYTLIITQDGTGHVYSLSGVKFSGGTAPTYSTAASKIDVISIIYDGTNFYGMGGIAFA